MSFSFGGTYPTYVSSQPYRPPYHPPPAHSYSNNPYPRNGSPNKRNKRMNPSDFFQWTPSYAPQPTSFLHPPPPAPQSMHLYAPSRMEPLPPRVESLPPSSFTEGFNHPSSLGSLGSSLLEQTAATPAPITSLVPETSILSPLELILEAPHPSVDESLIKDLMTTCASQPNQNDPREIPQPSQAPPHPLPPPSEELSSEMEKMNAKVNYLQSQLEIQKSCFQRAVKIARECLLHSWLPTEDLSAPFNHHFLFRPSARRIWFGEDGHLRFIKGWKDFTFLYQPDPFPGRNGKHVEMELQQQLKLYLDLLQTNADFRCEADCWVKPQCVDPTPPSDTTDRSILHATCYIPPGVLLHVYPGCFYSYKEISDASMDVHNAPFFTLWGTDIVHEASMNWETLAVRFVPHWSRWTRLFLHDPTRWLKTQSTSTSSHSNSNSIQSESESSVSVGTIRDHHIQVRVDQSKHSSIFFTGQTPNVARILMVHKGHPFVCLVSTQGIQLGSALVLQTDPVVANVIHHTKFMAHHHVNFINLMKLGLMDPSSSSSSSCPSLKKHC